MLFPLDESSLDQFFQRVVDGVLVFNMQDETDVHQPFLSVPMVDIVQNKDIQGAEIGISCSVHTADHPPGKGIVRGDHAVFKFTEWPGIRGG